MPHYFRFLVLLAFKIFAAEQVDVAILEVGIGGKLDPTNVEILLKKLQETRLESLSLPFWIQHGVPAFTVPQPEEAMCVLEDKASQLDVPLQVVPPLDANLLNGLRLGLGGEFQYLNAGLAVALCSTWLQRTGHVGITHLEHTNSLPEQFIKGLTTPCLQGRAQIVPDKCIDIKSPGDLVFYLDGAHTPESMEVCAIWFALSSKGDSQRGFSYQLQDNSKSSHELVNRHLDIRAIKKSTQILVFTCMSVRDPHILFPRLMETCASHGVCFKKALFLPNTSLHQKVGSHSFPPSEVDLSWQFTLQRLWENLMETNKGGGGKTVDAVYEDLKDDTELCVKSGKNSAVFSSLTLAIKWLRESVQQNPSVRFQVHVTGSLRLVGDVLKLVKV